MFQPHYTSIQQRPRAKILRGFGSLLLAAGIALNLWLLISDVALDIRLALLVIAPGGILLFTAYFAENTPSMRGCLSVFGFLLAILAVFWAWVGVTVAISPEDEPPEILREAPVVEPEPEPEPEEEPVEETLPPDDGLEPDAPDENEPGTEASERE